MDRPHYHSRIFFCSAAIFGRELAGFVEVSDLEPKKASICRILTEMVQPKVGRRLSATEYLFSVSSQPSPGKCREIREGSRKVHFWMIIEFVDVSF